MAAINNTDSIMEVVSHEEINVDSATGDMSSTIENQVENCVTDDDILNEALVTAPESFTEAEQLQYTMLNENGTLQDGVLLDNSGEQVSFISSNDEHESPGHLTGSLVSENQMTFIANENQTLHQEEGSVDIKLLEGQMNNNIQDSQFIIANTQSASNIEQQPLIVTRQIQASGSAPLGSSQNPIRIIQQGNQYTPVQQLSTDQLQQIMHVVQQQQSVKNPGSSVLYNSQTNTKIVYRVIYPSQLHKDTDGARPANQQDLLTPKRTYKKRMKEDEQERIEGPELSREEKEMRKKVRPKTRSGRVSKPPKHMVKDFKHIHVLDYDEDYDDDDGGYSDFKMSEGEEEGEHVSKRDDDDNFVAYGLDSNKPKNWKCMTCGKAYIGRAGLGRHLRLNPTHGSMDAEGEGEMEPPDPSVTPIVEDSIPNTPATPNGMNSTANSTGSFSEDSRDSSVSLTYNQTPRPRGSGYRGRPRGFRGRYRGRGAYSKQDPETRRRNKLKEAARECTDEELMEIVLPRLAKVITLWEFLLMKVEKGDPAWPHADDIYREYERLHQHVKKLCQEYLQYLPETDQSDYQQSVLQVDNSSVAEALGLTVGCHKVKAISNSDTDVQYRYKFLTTKPSADQEFTNKSNLKRTVEVVSPEELASPTKKPRMVVTSAKEKFTVQEDELATYSAVSSTNESHKLLLMNPNSSSIMSVINTTSNNKKPLMSNVQILSSNSLDSRKTVASSRSSGKTVSLLSNPLSSTLSSSSPQSTFSTITSLPQSSANNLSQKIIIVSGMNQAQSGSASPNSSVSKLIKETYPPQRIIDKENQFVAPVQGGSQYITIPNGQNMPAQNKILIHDSVTGTYTVADLTNGQQELPQATSEAKLNTVSQPVFIKLPQQSSASSQYLQPKLVLNDMNVLNSVPTDAGDILSSESSASAFVGESDISHILTTSTQSVETVNTVNSVGDAAEQNVVFTYQNSESQPFNSRDAIPNNVVYTFANESAANSQENIVFVNPASMFLNKQDTCAINGDMLTARSVDDSSTAPVLLSNGTDEVIGVINSVDNVGTVKIKTEMNVESDHQSVDLRDDQLDSTLESGDMSAAGLRPEQSDSENINSLAAIMNNSDSVESSVGPGIDVENVLAKEDMQSVETAQIPATSIFQTEDGLIFIQNPDGTTLQLQGSDGQAVSMETVQALLGMDGETQFVTELSQ